MKYILLFIHALTISIYTLFFVDPVTLSTNFPENAKPGTEFTAEITINKGSNAGFAKFQLELPPGFSAKEADSKGGSFTLSGQTAKIIWTSVPSSPEFTIKMTIVVDGSASGDYVVTGKYSYIDNNNKQQADMAPVTVKVASDAIATTTRPETTNTLSPVKEGDAAIAVTRNITPGSTEGEYEVELKIKKDAVKGFAKLQEKTPDGFVAVAGKNDEASFNFSVSEKAAKFIWTSIPAREELVVSYKLVPKKGVKPKTPAFIEGEFSYLENQQSKKYTVEKQELPLVAEPVATNTVVPTNTVEPVNTNTVATTETVTPSDPVTTNTTVAEPVKTETTAPVSSETTEANSQQKNSNVHYSVQVGAFKMGVNVKALSARYSLSGVRTEMQDGFTKCITGKHNEYRSARDARENIRSKGVSDAFVTAYNTGRRITVQEALMITSQKWFR